MKIKTIINGVRVKIATDKPFVLKPGEYALHERGNWFAMCPNDLLAGLADHKVTEHEDGTITVSPSILVRDSQGNEYHGYLERGVWREV